MIKMYLICFACNNFLFQIMDSDSPSGYKVTFLVTEGRFKRSIGLEVDEQAGGAVGI